MSEDIISEDDIPLYESQRFEELYGEGEVEVFLDRQEPDGHVLFVDKKPYFLPRGVLKDLIQADTTTSLRILQGNLFRGLESQLESIKNPEGQPIDLKDVGLILHKAGYIDLGNHIWGGDLETA